MKILGTLLFVLSSMMLCAGSIDEYFSGLFSEMKIVSSTNLCVRRHSWRTNTLFARSDKCGSHWRIAPGEAVEIACGGYLEIWGSGGPKTKISVVREEGHENSVSVYVRSLSRDLRIDCAVGKAYNLKDGTVSDFTFPFHALWDSFESQCEYPYLCHHLEFASNVLERTKRLLSYVNISMKKGSILPCLDVDSDSFRLSELPEMSSATNIVACLRPGRMGYIKEIISDCEDKISVFDRNGNIIWYWEDSMNSESRHLLTILQFDEQSCLIQSMNSSVSGYQHFKKEGDRYRSVTTAAA